MRGLLHDLVPEEGRGRNLTRALNENVDGNFLTTEYTYENVLVRVYRKLCCQSHGILWNFATVYPPKVEWNTSPPAYFGGAVLDVVDAVRQHLTSMSK